MIALAIGSADVGVDVCLPFVAGMITLMVTVDVHWSGISFI